MNNEDKLYELLKTKQSALNKIKGPMDVLLQVPFEDCPYYAEKYGKKYGKAWYTINTEVFFSKVMDNLINYDPLFAKITPVFKKRLQVTLNILLCSENDNDDRFLQKTSKKYPSWAKLWHNFFLSSALQGEFPWEDINDQIVFKKYDTYVIDTVKCDIILGFKFSDEYNRVNKLNPDHEMDEKFRKHKNSVNKKVS